LVWRKEISPSEESFLWQLGQDVLRLLPLVFGDQGLGETEQFLFAQPGSVGQDLLVSRHGLGNQLLLGIEVGQQTQFVHSGHAGSGTGFEQGDRLQFPAIHEEDVGVGQPETGLLRSGLDEVLDQRFSARDLFA